ncbi:hypothetical protein BH10PLA1_BH10PLA1_04960 [soil metagenome]
MAHALLGGFLIFLLRLGDVPISTVRTMLMVQGRKWPVALLAVIESAVWVVAISRVLSGNAIHEPIKIAGYAIGFATGTVLGMVLESWLAIGKVLVRVISEKSVELREKLLDDGFGVTAIRGEGRQGEVLILFVVSLRRREKQLLRDIQCIDPHAFITVEQVGEALGGFVRNPPLSGGGH